MDLINGGMNDVAHAIQLALAPVFLLTGIAGILNVMAHRLARIIDRGRRIEDEHAPPFEAVVREELLGLERRRALASWAINACTGAALLVCVVIAVLFAGALLGFELRVLAGVLFIAATLLLIVGLTLFLGEVHMATRTVRLPRRF